MSRSDSDRLLDVDLLSQIPWRQIAAMRDQLAHRYFDTSHAIVQHTVTADLADLMVAVRVLIGRLPPVD